MTLHLHVDGRAVDVADDGASLLEVLRDRLGIRSPKDGCGPQGQCGCCTVLVDGQPRVACVTPARRVAGRTVTTLDGLPDEERRAWADAFTASGGSQCGFCTPGIIVRLAALRAEGGTDVDTALLAHLCRCTGWQGVKDAFAAIAAMERPADSVPASASVPSSTPALAPVPAAAPMSASASPPVPASAVDPVPASASGPVPAAAPSSAPASAVHAVAARDLDGARRRARLEGGTAQDVGPHVALGQGGFADDSAPLDALVAVPDGRGGWAVGETVMEARARAGKVQGRRSTIALTHPLDVAPGEWAATLRTTWVEPAYLEPDASWCAPGGEPASPLGNGGAFGAKTASPAPAAARRLADEHGRPVRVLLSREDVVREGPKRPPVAGAVRPDGTGVLRVARTPGIAAAVAAVAPLLVVEEVDVLGPPTSSALRAAGWAEAAVLLAAARGDAAVVAPSGARAEADIATDGSIRMQVRCGDPLDDVVLRSYCVGAAHMALGWVRTEGVAVGPDGTPHDLTIRSFAILRARDMPEVRVEIVDRSGPPLAASDAVFAAVAAAAWRADGYPPTWPTRVGGRGVSRPEPGERREPRSGRVGPARTVALR